MGAKPLKAPMINRANNQERIINILNYKRCLNVINNILDAMENTKISSAMKCHIMDEPQKT